MKKNFLFVLLCALIFSSCVIVAPEKGYLMVNNNSICECEYISAIKLKDKNGYARIVWTGNIDYCDYATVPIEQGEYSVVATVRRNHNILGCRDWEYPCNCYNCRNGAGLSFKEVTTTYKYFSADNSYSVRYDGAGLRVE